MKNCILIFVAILLGGCGRQQTKIIQQTQDSIYLAQYIHPVTIVCMNDSLRQIVRDSIHAFRFDTMHYHTIADIDNELAFLFKVWYNDPKCWGWDDDYWMEELINTRLRYHLNNSITFTEGMPMLDSLINIIVTPDRKYKFFSYEVAGYGTAGAYTTYYQYQDATGKIHIKEWQENIRDGRLIEDIWQFNHVGQDYYVIKSFYKGQACSWYYYMEIITIEDGEVVYHTEFYPKGTFESHNVKYLIYDENGKAIDECWKPAYDIMICYTDNRNANIDYSFDPKTLTVHVKDDADTTDSITGAIKEYSLKLVLPPNNIRKKK